MTNQEKAINYMKLMITDAQMRHMGEHIIQFYELAIAALEQQPCGECKCEAVNADRDMWKARAIALERAINNHCEYCVTNCHKPGECTGWQFDKARFSDKPTPCQDKGDVK